MYLGSFEKLPHSILVKILSYVPNHFIVASVCKKFYEVDCQIYRGKLQMHLDFSRDIVELDNISSIENSNRTFDSMNIFFGRDSWKDVNYKMLLRIMKKFGHTTKSLVVTQSTDLSITTEEKFLEFLKNFSGLLHLDVSITITAVQDHINTELKVMPLMPKLQSLALNSNTIKFFTKHLPGNVNTIIEKISELNGNINEFPDITENFLRILQNRDLKKLKLQNFLHKSTNWATIRNFIRSQPNLSSLDFSVRNHVYECEFYKEVAELKCLQELTMYSSKIELDNTLCYLKYFNSNSKLNITIELLSDHDSH